MRRPVDSYTRITSRHGDPSPGSFYGKHLGTDYAVGLNTPVKAPLNGRIAVQGWNDAVGNYIEIDGDDGRRHRVLHLNQRQIGTGVRVAEGQQIGLSGSTGSSSTGPHVHWDARKGGTGFGDGFANYVDTEALAAAPAPPAPAPGGAPVINESVVGRTLFLKPYVTKWRVYNLDQKPQIGKEIYFLAPSLYGGLSYSIERLAPFPQTVVIRTRDRGLVNIYVDGDAEIR